MSADAFPLSWPPGWPRTPAHERKKGDFKVKADQARLQLINELRLLGGASAVLSSNVPLRRDGTPSADVARSAIPDPGVAVYFVYKGKTVTMARDVHTTPADNMRSLFWALNSLRALERHGGGMMLDRAFEGFAALAPPGAQTARPWHVVLGVSPSAGPAEINAAYRIKAKGVHPDAGGSPEEMSELNAARDAGIQGGGHELGT